MSKSDEPGSTRMKNETASDNWGLTQDYAPTPGHDDRFPAAFAAARGTVSPELDLSDDLDEPAATDKTGDAGRVRPGA
jgi:hypothetical protein